jgi:hypothetical protein
MAGIDPAKKSAAPIKIDVMISGDFRLYRLTAASRLKKGPPMARSVLIIVMTISMFLLSWIRRNALARSIVRSSRVGKDLSPNLVDKLLTLATMTAIMPGKHW